MTKNVGDGNFICVGKKKLTDFLKRLNQGILSMSKDTM